MTITTNAPALTVSGLTKRYGDRVAVDDLDLQIPRGVVAGFIGPNGAGKTTTMAMLVGLARPSGGDGTVLGASIRDPEQALRRVGALLEGPAMWPSLTARQNLVVLARLGGQDEGRIAPVLELVGSRGAGRGPVRAVLARDEAAARYRGRVARRSRAADPRRAHQRPRPGRDQRHARAAGAHRGRRPDRPGLVAPAQRARADLRLAGDHRRRAAALQRSGAASSARRPSPRSCSAPRIRPRWDGWRSWWAAAGSRATPRATTSSWRSTGATPAALAASLNGAAAASGIVLGEVHVRRPTLESAYLDMLEGVHR